MDRGEQTQVISVSIADLMSLPTHLQRNETGRRITFCGARRYAICGTALQLRSLSIGEAARLRSPCLSLGMYGTHPVVQLTSPRTGVVPVLNGSLETCLHQQAVQLRRLHRHLCRIWLTDTV